jgi:hypothetical protein
VLSRVLRSVPINSKPPSLPFKAFVFFGFSSAASLLPTAEFEPYFREIIRLRGKIGLKVKLRSVKRLEL